jgi:regulator of extracellular matrix RemA (YlzA/DUF370 family)
MPGPFLGSSTPTDSNWIARDLAKMQRQIDELRSARSLENATIGRGGLVVTDGSSAAQTAAAAQLASDQATYGAKGGSIMVADAGGVIWDSFRDLSISRAWIENIGSLNFTSSFTEYMGTQTIAVPYGMTQVTLTINVAAGETLSSGTGNLSVAPVIHQLDGSGALLQDGTGNYINSGTASGPIVSFSFASVQSALAPGCAQMQMGVSVADGISGGGARSANSGNWQGACLAVFSRGF